MANLIKTSHPDSDELAKFTKFNLFDENLLFRAEETNKENISLNNEDSNSWDSNAGNDLPIF